MPASVLHTYKIYIAQVHCNTCCTHLLRARNTRCTHIKGVAPRILQHMLHAYTATHVAHVYCNTCCTTYTATQVAPRILQHMLHVSTHARSTCCPHEKCVAQVHCNSYRTHLPHDSNTNRGVNITISHRTLSLSLSLPLSLSL